MKFLIIYLFLVFLIWKRISPFVNFFSQLTPGIGIGDVEGIGIGMGGGKGGAGGGRGGEDEGIHRDSKFPILDKLHLP